MTVLGEPSRTRAFERGRVLGVALVAAAALAGLVAIVRGPDGASASATDVCDTLMSAEDALHAMGETNLPATGFSHDGRIITCTFGGNSPPEPGSHSMSVVFGGYAHLRTSRLYFGYKAAVCHVSVAGCDLVKEAEKEDHNLQAFVLWAKAFHHAGTVQRLDGFRGNPAIIWQLKHPPLAPESVAIVYHDGSGKALQTVCTVDNAGVTEPDNPCTLAALKRAFHNFLTSR